MFQTIIFIVLLLVVGIVAWKIIKSIIKALLICLLIIIFVLAGAIFFIYSDLSGISTHPMKVINMAEERNISVFISGSDIAEEYAGNESVREFIITPAYFGSLPYPIEIDGQDYSKSDVLSLTAQSEEVLGKAFNYTLHDKYLYKEYRKGNLDVIPKTIGFKTIDKLPAPIFWIVTLF